MVLVRLLDFRLVLVHALLQLILVVEIVLQLLLLLNIGKDNFHIHAVLSTTFTLIKFFRDQGCVSLSGVRAVIS